MNNDIVWGAIIIINIFGFFIRIERPVWVYNLQKNTTIEFDTGIRSKITFNLTSILFLLFIAGWFIGIFPSLLSLFFSILVLSYTVLALVKIFNALSFYQTPHRNIVTILDTFVFFDADEYVSRRYLLVKVAIPELGVRVLPAIRYNHWTALEKNSNVLISVRTGLLGIIYRFPFDY